MKRWLNRHQFAVGALVFGLVSGCRGQTDGARVEEAPAPAVEQKPPPARVAERLSDLKDKDPIRRKNTVYVIGRELERWIRASEPVEAELEAVVPALAAALRDEDDSVRANAADALGTIGARAQGAIPALVAALKDGNLNVRHDAAKALGAMGSAAAAAIPALTAAVRDDREPWSRDAAADALKKIGQQ